MLKHFFFFVAGAFALVSPPALAVTIGSHRFISRQACVDSGKLSKEICANAESNAAAEFEEKAPHFPTRQACEQAYRPGACALSIRPSAIGAGAKGGVSFTPRQQGFRIMARSDFDISTTPMASGLNFSPRTAVRPSTSINPKNAGMAAPRPAYGTTVGGTVFGTSEPTGEKGMAPPLVPYDPNFDCSAFVEPSAKGDPNTACVPMRKR